MRPDLVIVGDSHTGALQEAALARGLASRVLCISGNFWHEGRVRFDARLGLSAGPRPRYNRLIQGVAEDLGGSVFPRDVPVIASIGYHLGRLVPRFLRYGHTPDAQDFAADPSRLFGSSALVDAYIAHHRRALWRTLRFAAQVCPLVVVAPPVAQADPASMRFAAVITDRLLELGLTVFDPRRDTDLAGNPFPPEWRAADGQHGNAAYGEVVLRRLTEKGLLRLSQ